MFPQSPAEGLPLAEVKTTGRLSVPWAYKAFDSESCICITKLQRCPCWRITEESSSWLDQNFSKDIDVVQREVLSSADHRVVAVQQRIVVFSYSSLSSTPSPSVSAAIGLVPMVRFQAVKGRLHRHRCPRHRRCRPGRSLHHPRFLGCIEGTVEEGGFISGLLCLLTIADSIVVIIPVDPVQFPVIVVIGAFPGDLKSRNADRVRYGWFPGRINNRSKI